MKDFLLLFPDILVGLFLITLCVCLWITFAIGIRYIIQNPKEFLVLLVGKDPDKIERKK